MDFDTLLAAAWDEHVRDAAAVATRLDAEALAWPTQPAQVGPLANLAHHVHGEHLGRWAEGIAWQQRLAALPVCEPGSPGAQAVQRYIASLALAGGLGDPRGALSPGDAVRVGALAAMALGGHDSTRAATLLHETLARAEAAALPASDPALRALAIAGNNLACTMEEKTARTAAERALMILAAQTGRTYWAQAGTWVETERAEYRLAMTWVQAGDLVQARRHAQACLEIVQAQAEPPALETFFAWEALGVVERAAGNTTGHAQALRHAEAAYEALAEEDRGWCGTSLEALRGAPVTATA